MNANVCIAFKDNTTAIFCNRMAEILQPNYTGYNDNDVPVPTKDQVIAAACAAGRERLTDEQFKDAITGMGALWAHGEAIVEAFPEIE